MSPFAFRLLPAVTFVLASCLASGSPSAAQDPTPVGGEFRVNAITSGSQVEPSLTFDGEHYVAVWSQGLTAGVGSLVGARFDRTGRALGEFEVVEESTSSIRFPTISSAADGRFVVGWAGRGENARLFSADDTPIGAALQVVDDPGVPIVGPRLWMAEGGAFVVAWSVPALNEAFIRSFSTSGAPLVDSLFVDVAAPSELNIVGDDLNRFAVAYSKPDGDGRGVFGRCYEGLDPPQALGEPFQLNTYTTDEQFGVRVASNNVGSYVAVWSSEEQDGDWRGIFGRRFSCPEGPLGEELAINSITESLQGSPEVAVAPGGEFVVTWSSYVPAAGSRVSAQAFDAFGSAVGTEFRVDLSPESDPNRPFIAFSGQQDFMILWESFGQDGFSWGLFARRFRLGPDYAIDVPALGGYGVVALAALLGLCGWAALGRRR
ncbi:MAG: hypothetical protein AAGM22_03830 [Acidobacteriota bacterium]